MPTIHKPNSEKKAASLPYYEGLQPLDQRTAMTPQELSTHTRTKMSKL